jgi:hypothetical protein
LAAGRSAADFAARAAKWTKLVELTMTNRIYSLQRQMVSDPNFLPTHKVSPFVVWLCTDAARDVNGYTFEVHGDTINRVAEPVPERTVYREGGWDLDSLDAVAPGNLVDGLANSFTLDEYPDLKVFKS